jgi:hypothetical protein
VRKLTEPVPAREAETLAVRLLYCAGMLHMGGFMSDGERKKVHARMMKWKALQKGADAVAAGPRTRGRKPRAGVR